MAQSPENINKAAPKEKIPRNKPDPVRELGKAAIKGATRDKK